MRLQLLAGSWPHRGQRRQQEQLVACAMHQHCLILDAQRRAEARDPAGLLGDAECVPQWPPASAAAREDDNVYDWGQAS